MTNQPVLFELEESVSEPTKTQAPSVSAEIRPQPTLRLPSPDRSQPNAALLQQLRPYRHLPPEIATKVAAKTGANEDRMRRRAFAMLIDLGHSADAAHKTLRDGSLNPRLFGPWAKRQLENGLMAEAASLSEAPTHRIAPNAQNLDQRSELLSLAEQHRLARAWKEHGDQDARNRMLLAFDALVKTMASEVSRTTSMSREDLCQEGRLVLREIFDKFNPDLGNSFGTFAPPYLKGAMFSFAMNMAGPCRVGTNALDKRVWRGFRRERALWELKNQRPLNDEGRRFIAERIGVKLEVLLRMEPRMSMNDTSMDMQVGDEEGGTTVGELFADTNPTPDEVVMNAHDIKQAMAVVQKVLVDMPSRDQEILNARLFSDRRMEFRELGDRLGITKERVRQIEARALKQLRDQMLAHGITPDILTATH